MFQPARFVLRLFFLLGLGLLLSSNILIQAQTNPRADFIRFYVTTSTANDAGTDDNIEFVILRNNAVLARLNPSNTNWDENEGGQTEAYTFNLSSYSVYSSDLQNLHNICIRTRGGDAWLISSVFVVAHFADTNQTTLANFTWDFGGSDNAAWLSTDRGEGAAARDLTGAACPNAL